MREAQRSLGKARIARELSKAAQIHAKAMHKLNGPWQTDEDDLCFRQGVPESAKRRHSAQKVAELQCAKNGHAPGRWISQTRYAHGVTHQYA